MQPIKTKLKLKGLFQSVDKWKSCTKALNKINKDNLELWTIQSSSSPRAENKHNKSPLMLFLMTIYCLLLWSCSYVPPARPTEACQCFSWCLNVDFLPVTLNYIWYLQSSSLSELQLKEKAPSKYQKAATSKEVWYSNRCQDLFRRNYLVVIVNTVSDDMKSKQS